MARTNKPAGPLRDGGEADSSMSNPQPTEERLLDSEAAEGGSSEVDEDDSQQNIIEEGNDKANEGPSIPLSASESTSNNTRGDKRKRSTDSANEEQAEEGDEGSPDSPAPPPWQPQNEQSTIEFTHIIEEYASKRDSGCKKAEYSSVAIDDHGNRWRLIIYVNGNGRASNHHLSLFLQVADSDDLPFGWKKTVSYVLTLEHPGGTSLSYSKRNPDKTFKLCPKAIDWGWSQFITSDRIQQEGFVADDTLIVRAQVTVKSSSVKIDEEDAELYLKCAVEEGDVNAVEICLDNGASVNCQFKDDLYAPLHTACSSGTVSGSIDVLQLLLEKGADPNASNKWKETPLLIAANNGHELAVAALLKHGADPSLCSEAGWSALTFAAHKGYDDIVTLLLGAHAPVNSFVTEDNSTPLHKACAGSKEGHTAAVKLLLEANADVHALNKWRETPLLTAANHGQSAAVELLLAFGADPCRCTDTGWSPLSIAAYKGHNEVVRMLLEDGAPTEEDDPTLSALLQAATKGLPDTVELLLRHGADHTVTTKKGDTALSIMVEQNLIDAAVDMVSEYGASIVRCSRDRKKVQRARLLINHRMKQQGRTGKSISSEDEDSQAEEKETLDTPPVADGSQLSAGASTGKRKKKGKSKGASAEEKAKAAEEALLLELEQEEAVAKKEEAEANKKQAKKKKKKERERLQKMKEEQERREMEEKERKEQERVRREKEERERKEKVERMKKLEEEREAKMKELLEKERINAAKKAKEKERERKKAEQQRQKEERTRRETMNPASPSGSSSSTEAKQKQVNSLKDGSALVAPKSSAVSPGAQEKFAPPPVPQGNTRGWEKTPKASPPSVPGNVHHAVATSSPTENRNSVRRQRPVHSMESSTQPQNASSDVSGQVRSGTIIEHPAIALHRKQKVSDLLEKAATTVSLVDRGTVKRSLWKWLVRTSHSGTEGLDPLIPSASNHTELTGFFQRQLIAEARRRSSPGSQINLEQLKEAGYALSNLCQSIAKDMSDFRLAINRQLSSSNWDDAQAGMSFDIQNGATNMARVSWANRAAVYLSVDMFGKLRERFKGNQTRLLSAVFAAKVWDETKQLYMDGTDIDLKLPLRTINCLCSDIAVSAELYSDAFSVTRRNAFWSSFPNMDTLFGGYLPFSSNPSAVEVILAKGGSVCGLLPSDAFLSHQYLREILNTLDAATARSVPVSFALFLTDDSLSDPKQADLALIDPRFRDKPYVQRHEVLPAGQHVFATHADSVRYASRDSVFLVLQNEVGRARFPFTDDAGRRVLHSMSTSSPIVATPLAVRTGYAVAHESPLTSPTPYFDGMMAPPPQRTVDVGSPRSQLFVPTDLGPVTNTPSMPFATATDLQPRSSARRGRLFDLVDDVEEDNANNEVDLVSGMLNNLDVGLFQSASTSSDIDIEAISLMGIGGNSLPLNPRSPGAGTFR